MKNKILGLCVFTSLNLFALDINQAVQIAVQNNFELKKQKYILDESEARLDASYGGFKPRVDLNYNYNNRDELITGQIKEDSVLSATISYNLFNGFMDMYNIGASKDLFKASKFTYEASKQDLVLNVKKAYINYLLQEKTTQTFQNALKSFEKQYFDSQNFFNQGLIAKNELLEIEVQMLQAKQNYQNSKSSLKISKLSLANVLGKEIKNDEVINPLNQVKISISNYELEIENRSEVKALELLTSSYKSSAKGVKGSYYPKVDASFSYNQYGEDMTPNDRTGYPDNQGVGSLNVSWNLYNGNKDSSTIAINKNKASQTKMALEDLKQQIKLQYQNAKEQLEVSKLNLKTATKALETSKLNYEIVSDKVQEGLSSNKDLIDANYLQTKAQQNYFDAYYNRYLAVATLQRVLESKK